MPPARAHKSSILPCPIQATPPFQHNSPTAIIITMNPTEQITPLDNLPSEDNRTHRSPPTKTDSVQDAATTGKMLLSDSAPFTANKAASNTVPK